MSARSARATRSAPRSHRRAVALSAIAAGAIFLSGCTAVSPTTTYTDSAGDEVTVDWRDYPADAFTDAEAVLALPTVEKTAQRWAALRAEIVEAIEAEVGSDLEWTDMGLDGWYPYGGNGYGGTSMIQVYNSPSWQADIRLPRDDWANVLAAATEVLAGHGIPLTTYDDGDELKDLSHWLLTTDYFSGGEFLSISVQDASFDADALSDAEEYGHQVAGISLFYGIQTISSADRVAFTEAAAPFTGLARPAATHSD